MDAARAEFTYGAPALLPAAADPVRLSYNLLLSALLFSGGCLLHAWAYGSVRPWLVAVLYYCLGAFFFRLMGFPRPEALMYRISFATCFFMAGIAAVYMQILGDYEQTASDPANFYALAAGSGLNLTLQELQFLSEGAGAILLWRSIYNGFDALGFERAPYIGILANVLFVAGAGVFTLKIARQIFGDDAKRLDRVAAAFSATGIFWLFAAIHLRDSLALLGATILTYFWVLYLAAPRLSHLLALIAASLAGLAYFGSLRTEFTFLPFAMLGTGLAAILLFNPSGGNRRLNTLIIAAIGLALAAVLYLSLKDEIFYKFSRSYETYMVKSGEAGGAESLGNRLIVGAPLPVRLVLGSAYLLIFPIPFWAGFQLEFANQLFKSFNALFFYAATPLFMLALWRVRQSKALRTPPIMFLILLFIGFTVSIAMTSLEVRHLGGFLAPFLVLLALPDLTDKRERRVYGKLLFLFLFLMGIVHVAWLGLKFA